MHYKEITANGNFDITINNSTNSSEVSIYVPADIGTASVTIGWLDPDGITVNDYLDGSMLVGESKRFSCGSGVHMRAKVSGFSAPFKIGYAS